MVEEVAIPFSDPSSRITGPAITEVVFIFVRVPRSLNWLIIRAPIRLVLRIISWDYCSSWQSLNLVRFSGCGLKSTTMMSSPFWCLIAVDAELIARSSWSVLLVPWAWRACWHLANFFGDSLSSDTSSNRTNSSFGFAESVFDFSTRCLVETPVVVLLMSARIGVSFISSTTVVAGLWVLVIGFFDLPLLN